MALLTKSPLSFLNVQAGRLTATSATAALEMDIGWPSFADAEAPFEVLKETGIPACAGMTDFKDRLKLADAEEGALTVVVSVVSPLVLVAVPLEELGATPELPQPTT